MIKFQYFPANIKSTNPIGFVSLERFILAQKKPKENIIDIFKKISTADDKKKAELKQKYLHFFTPCVHLENGRSYNNITAFTGLMVLDFDHIDNAEELKQHLFYEYDFIITAYLSPSKKGVKCLVAIPIVDSVERFKMHFNAIVDIMEIYDGFDRTSKNCVLPLFQSYDENLLCRSNYTTFTDVKEIKEFNYSPTPYVQVEHTNSQSEFIIRNFTTSINNIQTNGHPQLRSACIALGGYVTSGYLSINEAINLASNLIQNNHYLKKGTRGYINTAIWAINQGTLKQLIIK